ncbi:unnamed protein product [Lepidochelys olivacea]
MGIWPTDVNGAGLTCTSWRSGPLTPVEWDQFTPAGIWPSVSEAPLERHRLGICSSCVSGMISAWLATEPLNVPDVVCVFCPGQKLIPNTGPSPEDPASQEDNI